MKKVWVLFLLLASVLFGCSQSTNGPDNKNAGNSAPVITKLKAAPENIKVGEPCTITCAAKDPDGDELSYKWETSGLGYILGSGSSVTFSAASCCAGRNEIMVTVSDPNGESASRKVTVTVFL